MDTRQSILLEMLEELKEKETKELNENKFSEKWHKLNTKIEILLELCSIAGDIEVLERMSEPLLK